MFTLAPSMTTWQRTQDNKYVTVLYKESFSIAHLANSNEKITRVPQQAKEKQVLSST